MDVEEIAQMFLVSKRFYKIIRQHPAIFLLKKPSGKTVRICSDVPSIIFRQFFIYFGEYIRRLQIEDLQMYAVNMIIGFCDDLQYLEFGRGDMLALDFVNQTMPHVMCVCDGIPIP